MLEPPYNLTQIAYSLPLPAGGMILASNMGCFPFGSCNSHARAKIDVASVCAAFSFPVTLIESVQRVACALDPLPSDPTRLNRCIAQLAQATKWLATLRRTLPAKLGVQSGSTRVEDHLAPAYRAGIDPHFRSVIKPTPKSVAPPIDCLFGFFRSSWYCHQSSSQIDRHSYGSIRISLMSRSHLL